MRVHYFWGAVSLAALGWSDLAAAQDGRQLIVTARRMPENLDKVPQSLSRLSAATLEDRLARDVRDLPALVPSLQLATAGWRSSASFSLRGQTTGSYAYATPSVQVYLDDVPLIAGMAVRQFMDLDHVEVLRGPQGTLFGRASNGGAIRFLTQAPEPGTDAELRLRAGERGERAVQGAMTLPLAGPTLRLRVAAQLAERDGFTNIVGTSVALDGKHDLSWRASLMWEPAADFSTSLLYDATRIRQSAGSALLYSRPRPCALGPAGLEGLASCAYGPGLSLLTGGQIGYADLIRARPEFAAYPDGLQDAWRQQQKLGPRRQVVGATGLARGDRQDYVLIAHRTEANLGTVTIRNILAWQRYRDATMIDQDGTIFPLLDNVRSPSPGGRQIATTGLSDEVQLSGTTGGVQWVAGLFAQRVRSDPPGILSFLLLPIVNPQISNLANDEHSRSRAIFAQAVVPVARDVRLTIGARRTWDRVARYTHRFVQPYDIFSDTAGLAICAEPTSADLGLPFDQDRCVGPAASVRSRGTNWTLGLDYQASPDWLIYLASRRGYRSGGLNAAISVPDLQRFAPEKLIDLEAGMKGRWSIGPVSGWLALAAYRAWMRDVQRQIFVTDPATFQLATITANAARARVDGIELEGEARVGAFSLLGNVGHVDARYRRFDIPTLLPSGGFGPPSDGRGNAFANTPRWTMALTGALALAVPKHLGDVTASLTARHQSGFWFSDLPQAERDGRAPGYWTFDARLAWDRVGGRPVDLALFARNLTNRTYVLGGQALQQLVGFTVANYGEPRIIGAELHYRLR
ncbi:MULTISPECIES: TonB-dependent receptor [unclassified Sphingobium]|uniref:TonB-dependent receptor n=1 Tax=unclassified Sphingobium TaxID=2611147 RepID=UPI0035A67F0C